MPAMVAVFVHGVPETASLWDAVRAELDLDRAIALELDITQHTVKFHVNAIMGKLEAQSRTEAVVRATQLGLIAL